MTLGWYYSGANQLIVLNNGSDKAKNSIILFLDKLDCFSSVDRSIKLYSNVQQRKNITFCKNERRLFGYQPC